jgi:copper(I)-binding protein
MPRPAVLALSLAWLSLAAPGLEQDASVKVDHAWSRAAMAGRNGVVYLTITGGQNGDRLISAASPVAEKTELHESRMAQGVMTMREVPSLPIGREQTVTLAPGGLHLMLMHLKQGLHEGDSVPVTLTFEKAGQVEAKATVAKAGASGPSGH